VLTLYKVRSEVKHMAIRKTVVTASAGALLLVLAAGCSRNKSSETAAVESSGAGKGTAPPAEAAKKADVALVRFINGTTSDKDLVFGEAVVFSGIGDRDVTAYKALPAERHDFKLFAKDDKSTAIATNSEGLTAGKHYTVLAVSSKDGKTTLDPVTDDLTAPAPGQARVRVINLAPGMENVDLYAGGKNTPLISGAGLDHPTDYKDVNPSEAELTVRHGMSRRNAAPVKDLKIEGGKLYTILVFQDKGGKLKVKTIEDQLTPAANAAS
jgi:Domain of unknown function (DUF4397)